MLKISNCKQLLNNQIEKSQNENLFDAYIDDAFVVSKGNPYLISQAFQYFNNKDRKAANIKKRRHQRITKEELKKVTQLFTPKYLADYLAKNAICPLLSKTDLTKVKNLRILDPAVGTGNLLFSVYEILFNCYVNDFSICEKEAKVLIANNLTGFDIDEKAARVCKRIFKEFYEIDIKITASVEVSERLKSILSLYDLGEFCNDICNYPEYGSLLAFDNNLVQKLESIKANDIKTQHEIDKIIDFINTINAKYDVVLMNPPYLASSDFGIELDCYINKHYKEYRTDLFQVFIKRGLMWLKKGGNLGVVCPFNWMFTIKFKKIRNEIIKNHCITNLAMLPLGGYKGAVVYLSAFVVNQDILDGKGVYQRLTDRHNQEKDLLTNKNSVVFDQSDFEMNPNSALIFWTDDIFRKNYLKGRLCDVMEIRQGLATGNNSYYLKRIDEIDKNEVCFNANTIEEFNQSGKRYAPYNKGGKYRKWYGNINYVILFDQKAQEELSKRGNKLPSKQFYFKPCITWTLVSSKYHFGARISGNSVFDVGGSCGFLKDEGDIYVVLGYLCSIVATYYLNAQNPTLNCQVGDIKNIPYIKPDKDTHLKIERLVKENIRLTKDDWENVLSPEKTLEYIKIIKSNEEELNKIFIDIYGLKKLDYKVDESLITLKNKEIL